MKTNVEVLESGAVKLTVTVEAAEVDARIKKTYKDYGVKYRFPGFRSGHVPRPVIDNAFGKDAVRGAVTDELVNELFPLAVDENDLCLITQPSFEEVDELASEGKAFEFVASFEVKPVYELTSYEPVKVEVPFKEASDAEVDEQINALGEYYYDLKNAPANTKVKPDSSVDIDLKVFNDKGEEIESLAATDRLYELGRGLFPAVFDEALVGMKKGETKTVEFNVVDNPCMMTSLLKDSTETARFEVEIKAVKKKVVPEFTDEWVKENLDVDSFDELRRRMKESIEQQKGEAIPRILENNALYELQQRLEGEAPAVMVEDAERDLLQSFFNQLQSSGANFDTYLQTRNITADDFKKDVKLQAEDTVKQNLALDAVARHEGMAVSNEDILDEFKNSGAEDYQKLYDEWKEAGRLHIVREGILRGRALEFVLEHADVQEVDPAEKESKESKKKQNKKAADSDSE